MTDAPPDITHWAKSRQIKHSGGGRAAWQSVTVAGSSEDQCVSFTLCGGWAQTHPISFPLLRDLSTVEDIHHFYLASTFLRTVTKCFTREEMNTINNNGDVSKALWKLSKKRQKKTNKSSLYQSNSRKECEKMTVFNRWHFRGRCCSVKSCMCLCACKVFLNAGKPSRKGDCLLSHCVTTCRHLASVAVCTLFLRCKKLHVCKRSRLITRNRPWSSMCVITSVGKKCSGSI